MRGKPGIVHARDFRLRRKPQRELLCIRAVPLHAQRQRLEAAQREEAVEGSADAADRVLQISRGARRAASSRDSPPMTTTPPTMSEWPFRYLVAECTTMSKPSSSGRCIQGLAKVLSATLMRSCSRAIFATAARSMSFSSGLLGVSTQSILVSGRIAERTRAGSAMSTKLALKAGRALAHVLEQPVGAAVQVVACHDMRAGVERVEQRCHAGQPRCERKAARAAFEVGDARLQRGARRVARARVVVALVHAGTRLHVGRCRVDRRHDRAGRRIGFLSGVNRARREAVLASARRVCGCGRSRQASPQIGEQIVAGNQAEKAAVMDNDSDVIVIEHRQQSR